MLYVIPNNGAYGVVAGAFGGADGHMKQSGEYSGVVLDKIDPVKLAEGFGMGGMHVEDESSVSEAIEHGLKTVESEKRPFRATGWPDVLVVTRVACIFECVLRDRELFDGDQASTDSLQRPVQRIGEDVWADFSLLLGLSLSGGAALCTERGCHFSCPRPSVGVTIGGGVRHFQESLGSSLLVSADGKVETRDVLEVLDVGAYRNDVEDLQSHRLA